VSGKTLLNSFQKNWLVRHGINPTSSTQNVQIPVEYIVGLAEFYGREFAVSPDVLIPRLETEKLVQNVVLAVHGMRHSELEEKIHIADVGTGSGCLGITLFLELKRLGFNSNVYLSDVSHEALEVSKKNLVLHHIPKRNVKVLESDLLENFPEIKFDFIVANLPYVPTSRIPTLDPSVKDFEPHLALNGGNDGLRLITKLINQAKEFLKPGGFILLEIDCDHKLSDFTKHKDSYREIDLVKDQFGRNRFVKLSV
jgi:release factor glutamine methyltransferase